MAGDADRKLGWIFLCGGLLLWVGLGVMGVSWFNREFRPPYGIMVELGGEEGVRQYLLETESRRDSGLWDVQLIAAVVASPLLLLGILGRWSGGRGQRVPGAGGRGLRGWAWFVSVFGVLLGLFAGVGEFRWRTEAYDAGVFDAGVGFLARFGMVVVPYVLFGLLLAWIGGRMGRRRSLAVRA
jgi:hypothetical protein